MSNILDQSPQTQSVDGILLNGQNQLQVNPLDFRTNNFWKIGFFVLLFLVVVLAGFSLYYFKTSRESKLESDLFLQPTPTIFSKSLTTPTISPIASLAKKVPPDWISKRSSLCGVNFFIPPETDRYARPPDPVEPYPTIDKSIRYYWFFEEWDQAKQTSIEDELLPRISRVLYKSPEGISFSLGHVEVSCSLNKEGISTETLFSRIKAEIKSGNFGFVADINSQRREQKWDRAVYVLEFEFDEEAMDIVNVPYYVLATKNYIYLIRKDSFPTHDLSFNQLIDMIFDNLQFEE